MHARKRSPGTVTQRSRSHIHARGYFLQAGGHASHANGQKPDHVGEANRGYGATQQQTNALPCQRHRHAVEPTVSGSKRDNHADGQDGAGDSVAKKLRVHKKYRAITDSYKDITTLAGLNDVKKHIKDLDNISLKKISGIFMERAENKLVKKALESTNWNRKRAAKLLDISYKSLLNKIKEYGLS